MTRVQGGERVYAAAQAFQARCLARDGSFLWPEATVWTQANLRLLADRIADYPETSPGTFLAKLETQVKDMGTPVVQLAADVVALAFLFDDHTKASTKASSLREIATWAPQAGPLPSDLEEMLIGLGSVGTNYQISFHRAVIFFLRFAEALKAERIDPRDAKACQELADRISLTIPSSMQARHVLLHLLFPDKYEAVASDGNKRAIVQALGAEAGAASEPDADVALARIRESLTARLGEGFSFYQPDVKKLWAPTVASLSEGFQTALSEYGAARQTAFTGTHPINAIFHSLVQRLQASTAVQKYPTLRTRFSTGQGNWARVPWIAVMDERITTSTQSGVYCVYLFREDGTGVYLTLAQGVTEPQRRLGAAAGKAELRTLANKVRASLGHLLAMGFSTADDIDLHTGAGLGSDYETSTIAYKLYERDSVPDDQALFDDLAALVDAYESSVAVDPPEVVQVTPAQLLDAFSTMLKGVGLDYGSRHSILAGTFLASILAKPLVLLTGLTGSGKTQIALKFGEWLGEARCLVVPVRPDWTGPESLFGYEDALAAADDMGRKAWYVPEPLEFMLRAARHLDEPHLLLLDEMNLAHVERYFADFLSGMESLQPTLPNLVKEGASWRPAAGDVARIPIPRNLWVVGTVNTDETTYAFSPKVLDRAQTIEFRVSTSDLAASSVRTTTPSAAPSGYLTSMLAVSADPLWQEAHPGSDGGALIVALKALHALLGEFDSEFGHRTFSEAIRFAAIHQALTGSGWGQSMDLIVLQMILPRIHGSRGRVENLLLALAKLCESQDGAPGVGQTRLPLSLSKIERMIRLVRTNQFVSFTE